MFHVFKIVCILFIELNIYYCLGCIMSYIKFFPKVSSPAEKFIYGFLGYHFVFWIAAFGCTYLNESLHVLKLIWLFVICVLMIACVLKRTEIVHSYKNIVMEFWKYKFFIVPCIGLVAFLIYFVCVNGQSDVDARTYIGEVTSIVDTGKLSGFSATTGQILQKISLKRSFTMFGVNSAVLCSIFKIHPLIFCRTVRASINIILLTVILFIIFEGIYKNYEEKVEHAIMSLMMAQSFLFLFANSIYTSSVFILYRTYEGKAYCSGVLILIAAYFAVKLCRTNDRRFFGMIFITMVTSMSISASATFITPLAAGCIVCAYIIINRKWKYIIPLFFSFMPNIVYILMGMVGISGFILEG